MSLSQVMQQITVRQTKYILGCDDLLKRPIVSHHEYYVMLDIGTNLIHDMENIIGIVRMAPYKTEDLTEIEHNFQRGIESCERSIAMLWVATNLTMGEIHDEPTSIRTTRWQKCFRHSTNVDKKVNDDILRLLSETSVQAICDDAGQTSEHTDVDRDKIS